jgi:polysaccharide pyruvyl transferase WcaK-like protein
MNKIIVISGIGNTLNNGTWAMAQVTISLLKKQYPNIRFIYITDCRSKDEERLNQEGIFFLYAPWTKVQIPKIRVIYSYLCAAWLIINFLLMRFFKINIFYRNFSQSLQSANLLIDLSGDSIGTVYSDYSVFFQILSPFLMFLIRKPYYFCAQSIGPFKNGTLYSMVKYVIKKSSLITARENITYDLLLNLGIKNNIILTHDLAFLLEPVKNGDLDAIAGKNNLKKDVKYVGVSISSLISWYSLEKKSPEQVYINIMTELCDYIVEKYGYALIFVPHTMKPGEDDRIISNIVKANMKNKNQVIVVEQELNGSELKGIIGFCSVFIASRMHAAIAALSQSIPTMVIAYNHKTLGIIGGMLNLHNLIIDIRNLNSTNFKKKCFEVLDYLINNQNDIKRHLVEVIPSAKDKALENILFIKHRFFGEHSE